MLHEVNKLCLADHWIGMLKDSRRLQTTVWANFCWFTPNRLNHEPLLASRKTLSHSSPCFIFHFLSIVCIKLCQETKSAKFRWYLNETYCLFIYSWEYSIHFLVLNLEAIENWELDIHFKSRGTFKILCWYSHYRNILASYPQANFV